MKRALILVVVAACSSSKSDNAFTRLASSVNPILEKLRPVAIRVRELQAKGDPDSRRALLSTCSMRNPELQALVDSQPSFGALDLPTEQQIAAPLRAKGLLDAPMELCRPGGDPEICVRDCVEGWAALTAAVDRLGEAAAKHDAKIVSLNGD